MMEKVIDARRDPIFVGQLGASIVLRIGQRDYPASTGGREAEFSAAKARILAYTLLRVAEEQESQTLPVISAPSSAGV
jgi:hypothetical protein